MDAIKTTEDAIASLRAARDAQLREFAEQEASLQADLEAATKAAEDQKVAAAKKAADDQEAAAAANAIAAAAAAAAASAKEAGSKACIILRQETNWLQILRRSWACREPFVQWWKTSG